MPRRILGLGFVWERRSYEQHLIIPSRDCLCLSEERSRKETSLTSSRRHPLVQESCRLDDWLLYYIVHIHLFTTWAYVCWGMGCSLRHEYGGQRTSWLSFSTKWVPEIKLGSSDSVVKSIHLLSVLPTK